MQNRRLAATGTCSHITRRLEPSGRRGGDVTTPTLVLLVDDEPDLLAALEMYLDDEGFSVVTARDGERAIALLEAVQPQVVVTDIMMPVMDGFEFLRRYKGRPGAAPVIAMSAFESYTEQAVAFGADAVLAKPFEPDELVRVLRQAAARKLPEPTTGRRPSVKEGEHERVQAIIDLGLHEPAPEASLQRLLEEVAAHFGVATALLSIITKDEQYWTGACGRWEQLSETRSGPREHSFCTHAVVAHAPLVVQDARANPIFKDNVFVKERGLRFYAGVPLVMPPGQSVGTLCLIDDESHAFGHFDLELLKVFGKCVVSLIERREVRRAPGNPGSSLPFLYYFDDELGVMGNAAFREAAVIEGARRAERRTTTSCVVLAVPARRLFDIVSALRERFASSLIGRLGQSRLGWIVPGVSAVQARGAASEIAGVHGFVDAAELSMQPSAVLAQVSALEAGLGDAGLL